MPRFPLQSALSDLPNRDEILRAVGKISVGKAGGDNGLFSDIIKCCGGSALLDFIVTLFTTAWGEQHVPAEWHDALLVPVPKKGDLLLCDNWRGISLLDVMGKLFARMITNRL